MIATVAACAALSGCSALGSPAAGTSPAGGTSAAGGTTPVAAASPASKVSEAQATHEYPSPAPPPQTAVGGAPGAVQAVRAFATRYINWTADNVAAQMRLLASESVGQARSAMQLAAAQTAQDYELRRGGIANSGTVEAVAPLSGGRDQYVVVTRELTSATDSSAYQGLHPGWHIALATVVRLGPRQWVLSQWQPES